MNSHSQSKAQFAENKMLAVPVWVQCVGFRCLAYRDAQNAWRDFHTHERLTNIVGLVQYNLTELLPA